jgi:hypothetical protein
VLPGMFVMSIGLGAEFVAATAAANAGVPHDRAGLTAALLNASQQLGARSASPSSPPSPPSRTDRRLAAHTAFRGALASGFHRALLAHLPACGRHHRPAHHQHPERAGSKPSVRAGHPGPTWVPPRDQHRPGAGARLG